MAIVYKQYMSMIRNKHMHTSLALSMQTHICMYFCVH